MNQSPTRNPAAVGKIEMRFFCINKGDPSLSCAPVVPCVAKCATASNTARYLEYFVSFRGRWNLILTSLPSDKDIIAKEEATFNGRFSSGTRQTKGGAAKS